MKQENIRPDTLTSAICNLSEELPLTDEERNAYNLFIRNCSNLQDMKIDSELMRLLAEERHTNDIDCWEEFMRKNKKLIARLEREKRPGKRYIPLAIKITCLAASIILISSTLYYLYLSSARLIPDPFAKNRYKATLMLSDNSVIQLDSSSQGFLTSQGMARISKTDSGQITYELASQGKQDEQYFNTLIVPRSGSYRLVLSDGSIVELNAESTISYPTSFDGPEREVTLVKGEAYFEIAHSSKPFVVNAKGTRNTVLGTKFNISTYDYEGKVTTTLVQGSVKVTTPKQALLLTPGQQAVFQESTGGLSLQSHVNTQRITAWKYGYFNFEDADLKVVMQQAERWYGVRIIFRDSLDIKGIYLSGFRRSEELSTFMKVLSMEGSKFHYQLNGEKEVIISR
ncbi:MAG: FecR domain-containing protein [Chitinophagaceae bacterium]